MFLTPDSNDCSLAQQRPDNDHSFESGVLEQGKPAGQRQKILHISLHFIEKDVEICDTVVVTA